MLENTEGAIKKDQSRETGITQDGKEKRKKHNTIRNQIQTM